MIHRRPPLAKVADGEEPATVEEDDLVVPGVL